MGTCGWVLLSWLTPLFSNGTPNADQCRNAQPRLLEFSVMQQTITVCDRNGEEHDYPDDDDTEYRYIYGECLTEAGEITNQDELQIICTGQLVVAVFFKPRWLKLTFGA